MFNKKKICKINNNIIIIDIKRSKYKNILGIN